MAVAKINKRAVEQIGPGEVVWDSEVKGFGIRRHTTEDVHYLVRYRFNGRQTFKRIGRHGSVGRNGVSLTPDTARNEAKRLLGLVASDTDPKTKEMRPAETFGGEVERYLAKRKEGMKPRAYEEIERHLMKHAKPMHRSRLAEIDRRALAARLAEIETEKGPAARNRVRSSLSAFFTWAVKEGLLDANPVTGTAKADEGGARERVLTQAELAEVWAALPQDHFGDIVRLLILTAQRREEIGALGWSEVDLTRGLIALPPERTKNRRLHELPLSPQAREIIERQLRRNSRDLIFGLGEGGFSGWSGCKERLDQAILTKRKETNAKAKLMPDWRLHDLRRTAATGMAELGVLPHIVETILNHVSGHKAGIAGIYNRARYEVEMREALVKWANYVEAIASPLRPKAVSVRAIPLEQVEAELPRASFAERGAWLARVAK
jgi:integrase